MEKDSLRKWLEGTLSEEEKREFESTEDFHKLQKILRNSAYFKAPEYDVEAELKRLDERKKGVGKAGKVVKINYIRTLLRIAASLVVFFSVWYLIFRDNPTSIQTLAGEKSEVSLPDGSEVQLNAMTSLTYRTKNWDTRRNVQLEGEAYFKVSKGSRFNVITPMGSVTVLGTQFNVKQRNHYFEVTCFEGQVEVKSENQTIKLTPSQMFRVINGKVQHEENISIKAPAWVTNESLFRSVPFIEVIHELERQYNTRVEIKNIDTKQLFTGGFTHENLKSALQSITLPLNATYKIQDDQHIVLSGEMD